MHESADFPLADTTLELSGDQLRQLARAAIERIAAFIDSLPSQPASNTDRGEEIASSVIEPLPRGGMPTDDILGELFERLVPVGFNTTSPGYLAYVPGGGLPHAAVADLIAAVTNRFVNVWSAAPALAQLEANVIRWFCDMVGYPGSAGGFLTTGGSLANWSALVTARRCRLPDNFLSGTIYASNQVHHSVWKGAMLAGFPAENLRRIEVDRQFRIHPDPLAGQIARDRRDGWTPFAIVGNAGTTNTGAVDDLNALADLAQREGMWLHVDAAYGGFFMLTDHGRDVMNGIQRADSITLDPHKGLFLPYGTGCLLARDVDHLRRAHSVSGDYMPPLQENPELVDFCQISPELSRDCRGLRIWLPLKMHGIEPFRRNLDEKLALARWVAAELRRMNDEIGDELEIVAEPQLSIVVFRLRRAGMGEAELNQLNQRFLARINASRRVFLNSTRLDARLVIRLCILSFRTHRDRIEECLEAIRRAVAYV